MAIASDILVDYTNKRIYPATLATTPQYTVNALYSYLMDLFDDQAQMDDPVPMSGQTPTAYTVINEWYIADTVMEWLYNGAISTSGYANKIHRVPFGGTYVNCVAGDIGKPVLDDAVAFGTLLFYNNDKKYWAVRTGSATIAASGSAMTITAGTGSGTTNANSATGESKYPNIYSLGTLFGTPRLYVVQNGVKLTDTTNTNPYWWSTGHIDILVEAQRFGTEIDNGVVTVFARLYPSAGGAGTISEYDHFEIDLSGGGRNPIPLATAEDLNNTLSRAAAKALADTNIGGDLGTGIDITFGSISRDLNNGNGSKTYHIEIDCNNQSLANVYEVMKWVTNEQSVVSLTTDAGAVDGFRYRTYGVTAVWSEVKKSPFGTFAGGKFFGARGVWLKNIAGTDIKSFQLIASDNTQQIPPNVVGVSVTSLVSGDHVLVATLTGVGGDINRHQYDLASGNNSGNATIVVATGIASDTPQAGYIRIEMGDGTQHLYKYTSWATSTFSGVTPTLTQSYSAGLDVWVPQLDDACSSSALTNTLIQSTSIPVIIRVRKKGIIPFEIEGTIGSNGLSQAAIRQTDGIVT